MPVKHDVIGALAAAALALAPAAGLAQLAPFEGAPDPARGVFIKAEAQLDDVRHYCVDVPGHLAAVDVKAAISVHSCKDGAWNYDQRFDEAGFRATGRLYMPQFKLCLAADADAAGSLTHLKACQESDPLQRWVAVSGSLRSAGRQTLCLTIDASPGTVSAGTRGTKMAHLVRPMTLQSCAPEAKDRQAWIFAAPSTAEGWVFPDGQIHPWP